MDKNAIKKYAVWARRELIERVSQRAMIYGITVKNAGDPNAESVNGHLLSQAEKRQRQALIRNIKTIGYEQVMEEVAYTWFNRFAALRFMEVNGYLPSHIRVFTNDAGEFKPQILAEAIHLELDGLDMNKVYELESANKSEELFKYLLIVQCNALNSILPGMFQRIEDYTELLLPDYLLREGSVIEQMVTTIPEEDWTDQVQIIGWLYQFYNIDTFNEIYDGDMSRKKIDKNLLPAATQMFTPDWVVRYMVENSIGYIWLKGHPASSLKNEWAYYINDLEQNADIKSKLDSLYLEYESLQPEQIRCIDPCMGSGHILCYMFDVLVRIYEDYGYTTREASVKIVENNLWGLDIDERAAQLSYFAVMMKARQYDRRFFNKKDVNGRVSIPQPHVFAIEESNGITSEPMHDMGLNLTQDEYGEAVKQAMRLVEEMHDAKEYGSIINVTPCNWDLLRRFAVPRDENGQMHLDVHGEIEASERLQKIINIAETISQKYDAVVTNPPYLNSSRMSNKMNSYVKKNYPDSRFDLAMVMYEAIGKNYAKDHGLISLVTTTSWMFISSFEGVRKYVVNNLDFQSIVDFGTELFEGKIGHLPIVAWSNIKGHFGRRFKAVRLEEYCYAKRDSKQEEFFNERNHYQVDEGWFEIIEGNPLCYWINDAQLRAFKTNDPLVSVSPPRTGMMTTNNKLFLREWYEVDINRISFSSDSIEASVESSKRWFPYNKGGDFQKWYGNRDLVVNWENAGRDIATAGMTSFRGKDFYFREGLTWTIFGYDNFAVRYTPVGAIFDIGGTSTFPPKELINYVLGFLNSRVASDFITLINPTVNIQNGDIKRLPFIVSETYKEEVSSIVAENIRLVKENYDSFEVSWDFAVDPLVIKRGYGLISQCVNTYIESLNGVFNRVKSNEERLNRIFSDIYNVLETTTIEVSDKKVSIVIPELSIIIKNLIMYAVGCMFGRYSLDVPGITYAGGEWDASKYTSFQPDKDAIIPICDDEYFEDDIVGRFVKFVEVTFGKETLEENLRFIADALSGKGSSREVIRNYFINDFYADHLKGYQKRPIYWLFDSGKKNGFKCLIYIHRYQPDTIARIRTDYVHEQQSRYRTAITDLEQRINGASTSERVKLNKQLATLQAQAEEIRVYEEKIHHLADQMIKINLDDGVKHNYEIFKDVLAKIK